MLFTQSQAVLPTAQLLRLWPLLLQARFAWFPVYSTRWCEGLLEKRSQTGASQSISLGSEAPCGPNGSPEEHPRTSLWAHKTCGPYGSEEDAPPALPSPAAWAGKACSSMCPCREEPVIACSAGSAWWTHWRAQAWWSQSAPPAAALAGRASCCPTASWRRWPATCCQAGKPARSFPFPLCCSTPFAQSCIACMSCKGCKAVPTRHA